MEKMNLKFHYDKAADILIINKLKPYKEQISEEIEDGVIVRFNPQNNEIESIEILSFSKKITRDSIFEIPIIATFLRAA